MLKVCCHYQTFDICKCEWSAIESTTFTPCEMFHENSRLRVIFWDFFQSSRCDVTNKLGVVLSRICPEAYECLYFGELFKYCYVNNWTCKLSVLGNQEMTMDSPPSSVVWASRDSLRCRASEPGWDVAGTEAWLWWILRVGGGRQTGPLSQLQAGKHTCTNYIVYIYIIMYVMLMSWEY